MITRPMLAATVTDITKLKYPLLATPKIDGIRCLVIGGEPVSRTFKPIPNNYIRHALETLEHQLDGELTVGDKFQECTSGIMSHDGAPDFTYHVFDCLNVPEGSYELRVGTLDCIYLPHFCNKILPQLVEDVTGLTNFEESCLEQGYEGVMLRSLDSPYKCGRSTLKEGYLLKLKRFEDAEAIIIRYDERMHNSNKQTSDNFGLAERSSHQENMIPMNTLGALIVRDIKTNVEFKIGTGFDDVLRLKIWCSREACLGKVITYKFQPHGVKDKPRCPVFKAFRKD